MTANSEKLHPHSHARSITMPSVRYSAPSRFLATLRHTSRPVSRMHSQDHRTTLNVALHSPCGFDGGATLRIRRNQTPKIDSTDRFIFFLSSIPQLNLRPPPRQHCFAGCISFGTRRDATLKIRPTKPTVAVGSILEVLKSSGAASISF